MLQDLRTRRADRQLIIALYAMLSSRTKRTGKIAKEGIWLFT